MITLGQFIGFLNSKSFWSEILVEIFLDSSFWHNIIFPIYSIQLTCNTELECIIVYTMLLYCKQVNLLWECKLIFLAIQTMHNMDI